jgi:hypothetical protein
MIVFLDTLIGFAVVMLGFSLIIMILNQAVAALWAHRGANLKWGLETLFRNIAPGARGFPVLNAYAEWLAERTATHPLASDSLFSTVSDTAPSGILRFVRRWQFANAIKPDELRAILKNIVDFHPAVTPAAPAAIPATVRNTSADPQGLPSPVLLLLSVELNALLSSGSLLDDWFHRVNARVAQRFTMWMRVWTIVFSLVLAVGLNLDAVQLLTSLYKQGDVRAQLVGAAPQLSEAAKRIIPAGATNSVDAAQISTTNTYTDALNAAVTAAKLTPAPIPAKDIKDLKGVDGYLADKIADAGQREKIKTAYQDNFEKAFHATVSSAADVYSKFGNIKIDGIGWGTPWPESWCLRLERLAGVMASWLLLCLGAPFWFNTLNQLTSLRPATAAPKK